VASTNQHTGREVLFFIESKASCITANWQWNLHTESLFCSDVIWTADAGHHTKVLLHPDDKSAVKKALAALEKGKENSIRFRVITSYGEVVTIMASEPFSFSNLKNLPATADAGTEWAEKRWLQRQLEEASTQFRSYTQAEEVAGLGHWRYNSVTSDVWYSDGVFRLFKIPAQSLNPHLLTFQSFIHPDDRTIVTEVKAEAIQQQLPFQMEYRVICSDGTENQLREFCRWEFNDKGQSVLYGSFFLLNEILALEQKAQAAAEELAMEQRKLRLAEETTGVGVFEVNMFTRHAWVSDNYYRLLGLKPGSKPPGVQTLFDHIHPDDRAEVQKTIVADFAAHQITEMTFRLARPDGKVRTVRRKGRVLTNEKGQPVAIGILQDVTRQLVFEKELDKMKTDLRLMRLGQLLQDAATSSATWYWNLADNTVRTNDHLWQLLGTRPDAAGFSWPVFLRFVLEDDRLTVQSCLKAATKSTEEQKCRFRLLRKGELRQIEAVLQQQADEKGSWLMVSLQDVTDTHHLQKAMEAKEKFAQSLADNTVNYILVSDVNHQIQLWNRAFEETFSIPRGKAIGKNLFEVFPALQNETIIADLNKALAGETVTLENQRLVGTKEIVNIHLSPIHNDEGTITGVLHVLQNTSREFHLREQLTQRLAFIENLLEHSVDRIIVLDRHLNYQYWNRRAEDYYGISRDEVIGRNILELFPAFAADPSYPELRRVLRGETVYIPAQDTLAEKKAYYETYLVPLKTGLSDVSGILWIVHDLTKEYHLQEMQKRVQRQLEAEHHRLKEAQAIGKVGSFEWKVGETVSYWSDQLYRMHQLEPQSEEITTEKVKEFIHPDDFERLQNLKENSLLIAGDYKIIHRIRLRNGEERWVNHQWETIADDTGTVVRVSGVVQDITEQQKAEAQLLEQAHYLQRITETVPDMLSILELETGRFTFLNPDTFNEHGFSAQKLEAQTPEENRQIVFADDRAILGNYFQSLAAAKDDDVVSAEYRAKTDGGEWNWFLVRGKVFQRNQDGKVTHILNAIENITERKKAEDEILRLKDEIAQKATDKYYTIFNSIDQGFLVHEMVRDNTGKAVDFRLIEVNPAFTRQTGLGSEMVGKLNSEYAPNTEDFWIEAFDRVARTGISERIENYHQPTDRWYSVHVSKVVGEERRIAVVFEDVTERKQREQRQEFLLRFSDALRNEQDPHAIANRAIQMLFEELQVDRCYISEVFEEDGYSTVGPECLRPGVSPMSGSFQLADYPETMREMITQPLVIDDADNDPRFSDFQKQMLALVPQRALLVAPLRKGAKQVIWAMAVAMSTPRKWTNNERLLLEEVAERTWAAIERAKADEAVRESEEKFRTVFESIDEAINTIELIRNEEGKVIDFIYRETNERFSLFTGMQDVLGKKASELMPNLNPSIYKMLQRVADTGEILRREDFASDLDRWFEAHYTPLNKSGTNFIICVFKEITERKRREQQQEYLIKLNDTLRSVANAIEIEEKVTQLAMEYFKTDRCYYVSIEGEDAIIWRDAKKESLPSVSGSYPINSFAIFKKIVDDGVPFIVHDAATTEILDGPLRELCLQLQVISFVDVPVVKNRAVVGVLCIVQSAPRQWTEVEVQLAIETAERTWAAVERAKAETALQASELRLQLIADLVPDLLWQSEPDGYTNWYNQRWLEYTGQSMEEALGWGWTEAIHPDDREKSAQRYNDAVKNGDRLRQEHRIRRHDGEYRWFVVNAYPEKDESGNVVKMYGAATDIHESRMMLEALRQSEEQLRQFNTTLELQVAERTADLQKNFAILQQAEELAGMGSWVYTIATGEFTWSEGLYRLFGLPRGIRVQPEIYLDYVVEEDRSIAKRIIKNLKKTPLSFEETMQVKRGDSIRLLKIKALVINDETGTPQRIVGLDLDMTDIQEAEEKIASTQRMLEGMAMASPDAITIYDLQTKQPIYLNRCFSEWTGKTLEELVNMGIEGRLRLIHTDDRLRLLHFNEKLAAAKDGDVLNLEYRLLTADEDYRWLRNRAKVFERNAAGKVTHLLSILQDISEEKAAERLLKSLNTSLEKQNRELEAKNDQITSFAFVASHDLKEPIRKIHTFSDWLLNREPNLSESGRQNLNRLHNAAERLNILVDDILALTKVHVDKVSLVDVDLNFVLKLAEKEMHELLVKTGAEIKADPLPKIKGVENLLLYLFKNLLGNSIKFQSPGNKPLIHISSTQERGTTKLVFTDNGIGFSSVYKKKIFQMFRRLHGKTEFEGTGMGLAICKRIMEKHGGTITAESEEGKGASFTCWFPA